MGKPVQTAVQKAAKPVQTAVQKPAKPPKAPIPKSPAATATQQPVPPHKGNNSKIKKVADQIRQAEKGSPTKSGQQIADWAKQVRDEAAKLKKVKADTKKATDVKMITKKQGTDVLSGKKVEATVQGILMEADGTLAKAFQSNSDALT